MLARPVHVAVPQRDRLHSGQSRKHGEVVLRGQLGGAVRRSREFRRLLPSRHGGAVPVHRATRGREHHASHAAYLGALEQVEEPEDVDARIDHRVGDRTAHIYLRRVVVQDFECARCEQLARLRRAHVGADEPGSRWQVIAVPG